jgi:glycosyltransferase involved in cell wall biosynthesis
LRADPGREPVRIVSVARMEPPKDPRTLVEALAALRSAPWELDLVGDGPLRPEVRNLAARLGIAERVHMLGYLPDPARVLGRARIFALSSRSEAFPRSVLEALRAGLPVVASRVGGVSEAVNDGASGLLVPPSDPAALASALGRLIADAALRRAMGECARAAYEERFTLTRMVDETEALYRSTRQGGLAKLGK